MTLRAWIESTLQQAAQAGRSEEEAALAVEALLQERGLLGAAFLDKEVELDGDGFPLPSAPVAPPTTPVAPPATIQAAPPESRPGLATTLPQRVAGVTGQIVGGAAGIALESVDLGVRLLSEVSPSTFGVASARADLTGDQGDRMYDLAEEDLQARLGEHWYSNLATDIRDNIAGILELVSFVFGAKLDDETLRSDVIDALAKGYASGEAGGRLVAGGAVGMTVSMFVDPSSESPGLRRVWDSFRTRPLSTMMTVLPMLQGAKAALRAMHPRVAGLIDQVDAAVKFLRTEVGITAAGALASLPELIRVKVFRGKVPAQSQAEWRAAVRRWIQDGLAQADQDHAAIVERIVRAPERVKAEIEAIAGELASKVKKGVLSPDDIELFNVQQSVPVLFPGEGAEFAVPLGMAKDVKALLGEAEDFIPEPKDAVRRLKRMLNNAVTRQEIDTFETVVSEVQGRWQSVLDGQALMPEGAAAADILDAVDAAGGMTATAFARGQFARQPILELEQVADVPGRLQVSAEAAERLETAGFIQEIGAEGLPGVAGPRTSPAIPEGWRLATLADPEAERLVGELAQTVEGLKLRDIYPSLVKSPDVRRLLSMALETDARLSPQQARQVVASTLVDHSTQVLRDPKFRKRIVDQLNKEGPRVPWDELLVEMGEKHLTEAPFTYEVTFESPVGERRTVNLAKVVTEAMGSLDEAEAAGIRASAMQRAMRVVATKTADAVLSDTLTQEFNRFGGFDNIASYGKAIVDGVLVNGEAMPVALRRYSAREVAEYLDANRLAIVERVAKGRGDQGLVGAMKSMEELLRRLRSGYKEPSDIVRSRFTQAVPKEHITGIARGVDSSLAWNYRAMDALRDSTHVLDRLGRTIKANLTIANPASHINNFTANLVVQSLRRGIDPLTQSGRLTDLGRKWLQYRRGVLDDPELSAMFDRLQRTGALQTSLVDGEVAVLSGKAGKTVPVFDKLFEKMGDAYQFGDQLFKLEESVRNLKALDSWRGKLRPGEFIDLDIDPRRTVRLVQREGGSELIGLKGFEKGVVDLPLDGILARAATKPALDIFFDYGDVPNYVNFLRASRAQGIVSPFYTWFFKAMDLPGLKPGLLGEVLSGGFAPRTNSRAIAASIAQDRIGLAGRRAFILNALRANTLDSKADDALAELVSFIGREEAVVLVDQLSDPLYFESKDWSAANFAEPVDTVLRVVSTWSSMVDDPDDLWPGVLTGSASETTDKDLALLSEEDRRDTLKRRQITLDAKGGKLATFKDYVALLGVAGAPLVEAIVEMSSDRAGFTGADAYRLFGGYLMGGLLHKLADVGFATYDESSKLSTRQWALSDDPKETTDMLRWAIWRITGQGYRPARFDPELAPEKTINLMRTELKKSMTKALDRKAEALGKLMLQAKTPEEQEKWKKALDNVQAKSRRYGDIIEQEATRMLDERRALLRKVVGPLPQARPPATLPGEAAPAP